jgi:hypothetical protein
MVTLVIKQSAWGQLVFMLKRGSIVMNNRLRWIFGPMLLCFAFFRPGIAQDIGKVDALGTGKGVVILAQQNSVLADTLKKIRASQLSLSRTEEVQIKIYDEGLTSRSAIEAVPREFRQYEINDESDIIKLLPDLYRYYGFSGTESLGYDQRRRDTDSTFYTFQEKINGISTSNQLTVEVGNTNKKIRRFNGVVLLDRGFDKAHKLSDREAAEKLRIYFAQKGKCGSSSEGYSASLIYRSWGVDGGIAPWWLIRNSIPEPCYVDPNGDVEEAELGIP